MGLISVAAMLRGSHNGTAFGLTWFPAEKLARAVDAADSAPLNETLPLLASGLALDAVVVPATAPQSVAAVRALSAVNVAAVWAVDGVMTGAARLYGWSDALRLSAADPQALGATLTAEADRLVSQVHQGAVAGAAAVLIADELAADSGWLVAPDFALDTLMGHFRRAVRSTDLPVAFHSDGDIRAIHAALAHAGFSAVHVASGDEAGTAASFASARRAGMVPMGGIIAQELHRTGARAVGERAVHLAARGPAVICDDGGLIEVEDLAAFASALDVVRGGLSGA